MLDTRLNGYKDLVEHDEIVRTVYIKKIGFCYTMSKSPKEQYLYSIKI